MQLKFRIDPLYQAWLFGTFSNCHNFHVCSNASLFNMHWAMRLIKMHCIKSINIKMNISCNYSVDWTHQTLLGRAHQKHTWVLEKTSFILLVVLFFITELDMVYFLRKIFGGMYILPSPLFFKENLCPPPPLPQWKNGESWVARICQGVILTIWTLKAKSNIL